MATDELSAGMTSHLYTHALIRTLYDRGEDYIDCFLPLPLIAIPDVPERDIGFTLNEIQGAVEERFGLQIPIHSLSVILNRASRRGLFEKTENKFVLTEKGAETKQGFQPERTLSRQIKELLSDLQAFLSDKFKIETDRQDLETRLQGFIHRNIDLFRYFIDARQPVRSPLLDLPKLTREEEIAFGHYFMHVEDEKPQLYETLRDIVCGTILSAILFTDRLPDAKARFGSTTAFLDSNLLLSLLGLHHKEVNRPALELVNLIHETTNIRLQAYDFTVAEMISVLRGFASESQRYPPSLRIHSIYSSLRSYGWTPTEVRKLIINIEARLRNLGITIQPTSVDLSDPNLTDGERRERLRRFKNRHVTLRGANHDLAAVDHVKRRRGRNEPRRIEDAGTIFLSSDVRLARFNIREGRHRQQETIPEVILDRMLTNILWLKNPAKLNELSLSSIVSINAQGLVISRDVWDRFFSELKRMQAAEEVSEEDLTMLLYDGQLQEVLTHSTPKTISKDFVLARIDDARNRADTDHIGELEAKEEEFRRQTEELLNQKEADFQARLEKARQRISADTQKNVARYKAAFALVTAFVVVGTSVATLPQVLAYWDSIEPFAWHISVTTGFLVWFLGIVGFRLNAGNLRTRLEDWLGRRLLEKRLRITHLNELAGDDFVSDLNSASSER